jgi:hypothetical protein
VKCLGREESEEDGGYDEKGTGAGQRGGGAKALGDEAEIIDLYETEPRATQSTAT